MREYRLTEAETKFAEIIWSEEPVSSAELVKICEVKLEWKKSTTYTMLKRLEQKGIFLNQKGTVIALVSKEEFYAEQSKKYVEDTFAGSLPRFLAAFTRHKKLSRGEVDEIQKLIDEYKGE